MIMVRPSKLSGEITLMPSKSVLHRLLICAALAKGSSRISNFAISEDISATLNALYAMGYCKYGINDDVCTITGGLSRQGKDIIDCGESGSTLRFLLPLGMDGKKRLFTGRGRLMERPMQPYEQLFGYEKTAEGIALCGLLEPGEYPIDGGISSQFITGLLYKLPLLDGDSKILLTSALESRPYVDITRRCQALFGVESTVAENGFCVPGGQSYSPANVCAEGDYSHAAFFAAAAAMGGSVRLKGLEKDSAQGDREILDIMRCMGARVEWENAEVRVSHEALKPVEIDVSQIPDLVPILAVAACAAVGRTRIFGARRLRFKESDRLGAMTAELEKLGADIVEYEDSLIINGTGSLNGGEVCAHGDHRVVMALSMASVIAKGDIVIDAPEAVGKSAPRFFDEFRQLGGKTN